MTTADHAYSGMSEHHSSIDAQALQPSLHMAAWPNADRPHSAKALTLASGTCGILTGSKLLPRVQG